MVYNIYEVFLYIHLYAIDKHGFQNHTSITRVGHGLSSCVCCGFKEIGWSSHYDLKQHCFSFVIRREICVSAEPAFASWFDFCAYSRVASLFVVVCENV